MNSILKHLTEKLNGIYNRNEIQSIGLQLMQELCECSRASLYASNGIELDSKQRKLLESMINRLAKNEPIQYVVGHCLFFNIKLIVNKNVLIPRPETEELVEWIITDTPQKKSTVLDICTGSGCIAIALKKYKQMFEITATDISNNALIVAKNNASNNNCEITFVRDDILNTRLSSQQTYDIIVSNPPYVTESEKKNMQPNVLNYEPALALFVPDKRPLIFYEKIAKYALNALTPGGKLYFEINEDYGKKCTELLKEIGFTNIVLKKDMFGKDRMIRAQKNIYKI